MVCFFKFIVAFAACVVRLLLRIVFSSPFAQRRYVYPRFSAPDSQSHQHHHHPSPEPPQPQPKHHISALPASLSSSCHSPQQPQEQPSVVRVQAASSDCRVAQHMCRTTRHRFCAAASCGLDTSLGSGRAGPRGCMACSGCAVSRRRSRSWRRGCST